MSEGPIKQWRDSWKPPDRLDQAEHRHPRQRPDAQRDRLRAARPHRRAIHLLGLRRGETGRLVKLRRARSTTALLNEKPISAWFEPTPRPMARDPRPCHACCKTPGLGCAKNFNCPCHQTTKETPR